MNEGVVGSVGGSQDIVAVLEAIVHVVEELAGGVLRGREHAGIDEEGHKQVSYPSAMVVWQR